MCMYVCIRKGSSAYYPQTPAHIPPRQHMCARSTRSTRHTCIDCQKPEERHAGKDQLVGGTIDTYTYLSVPQNTPTNIRGSLGSCQQRQRCPSLGKSRRTPTLKAAQCGTPKHWGRGGGF
eukprot:scaffold2609_cov123-Isochrysis_galbana.AAC.3